MIGVDIVDLTMVLPQKKAAHLAYLQKICSSEEIALISEAPEPDVLLWRLWTMKESAYKIISRQFGVHAYIPKRLRCSILDAKNGVVHSEWGLFLTDSNITAEYIQTVAVAPSPFLDIYQGTNKIALGESPAQISSLARMALLKGLSAALGFSETRLSLEEQTNYPLLCMDGQASKIAISISHDGAWVAWAAAKEPF